MSDTDTQCLYCDKRPADAPRGLCAACHAMVGVRVLYERRAGWTPAWERHLLELTRRASARLPLFGDLPAPPFPAGHQTNRGPRPLAG